MVDASGRARITDFGLAQNQSALEKTHVTVGGTPRWTAPEILEEMGLSSKGADVFSFAMVMVEVGCE
jgi:serine/threonine protein kinase